MMQMLRCRHTFRHTVIPHRRSLFPSMHKSFSSTTYSPPPLQRGDRSLDHFRVNSKYHNFTLQRTLSIPEYKIDTLEFTHDITKAKYIHIDAKDANNVFCILFRTFPYNSNGVAHILEHTVLCGSEKYPIRDPFFNMLKRSLNTYMNALTGSDHTLYPFATTNEKDWRHLSSVYLDAVFFPRLQYLDFLQEGHRIHVNRQNIQENAHFERKGIVLNEMKGVFSDASQVFATKAQQYLYESSIYQHVSGGDPAAIPTLTYEQLKHFHRRNYHPSNACFYSYGDMPLTEQLQYLDQEILSRFEYQPVSERMSESDFSVHQNEEWKNKYDDIRIIRGPVGNMSSSDESESNATTKFCISKLLNFRSTDMFEMFAMRIVSYLLTDGAAAPMYKALIESGLAQDLSTNTGLDTSVMYPSFTIGVEGLEGSIETCRIIESAMQSVYKDVLSKGFDKKRVEALLHQFELSQKHIVGNFGMHLLHSMSSFWCHEGEDLLSCFQLNPLLSKLHEELDKDERFFEKLVAKHLDPSMTREKTVKVLMVPDESFLQEQSALEKEKLEGYCRELSEEGIALLETEAQELKQYQEKPQQIDCLPTLTLADIPREMPKANMETIRKESLKIQNVSIPIDHVQVPTTHGVTYLRLLFDTSSIFAEEKMLYHSLLPILTSLLGSLGTSSISYDTLPTRIQNCSGGISCSPISTPTLQDARTQSQQGILVSLYCLPDKLHEALHILNQILCDTQFLHPDNLKHFRTLLQMHALSASQSISSSGASLASIRSQIKLSDAAQFDELYQGLSHIELLQYVSACSEIELQQLAQLFIAISKKIFALPNLSISIVTEENIREQAITHLTEQLLERLHASPDNSTLLPAKSTFLFHFYEKMVSKVFSKNCPKQFFGFPITVNSVIYSRPSVSFMNADHVPLTVLAQMVSSCYIHQQVREKGGAYGSNVAQREGSFTFLSHSDPNTTETLNAYQKSLKWMENGEFKAIDVEQALLSIFSGIDAPITPSVNGRLAFIRGITPEIRRQRRHRYLNITREELTEVAKRCFQPINDADLDQVVIIGKDSDIESFRGEGYTIGTIAKS